MWLHGALLLLALAHLAICAEDFYKILGLDKQATEKQLKMAYRQLSKKYHPDKNPGDKSAETRFVEVSEAYEALSDAESRRIYDQYGHEGLRQHQQQAGGGGFQAHDPFDLFSRFFGGGGHFHTPGQRRGPNAEGPMEVPLRDFYNGAAAEFHWDKQHVCEACSGSGSADGEVVTCPHCNGQGILVQKHMLAPGMFQHVKSHCHFCGGRGKAVKTPCPVCHGDRVVRRPTAVQVNIPRGAPRDARLLYENEADASPDYVAGDLTIILTEKPPARQEDGSDGAFFRRRGDDLLWTEVISLREAWMGDWSRNLTHLDGHVVRLGRGPGQVVQPGHVETVVGEGMPKYDDDGDSVYHQTEFGNLLVEYVVVLPDQMEPAMESEFRNLWQKWRAKVGVDLHRDSGRRGESSPVHEEL